MVTKFWDRFEFWMNFWKEKILVQARSLKTSADFPVIPGVPDAACYHYCHLLSPARIMEWIYTDSLREKLGYWINISSIFMFCSYFHSIWIDISGVTESVFFWWTCSWTLMTYKLWVWFFLQIQFIIKLWLEPQSNIICEYMLLELTSKVSFHQRKSSKVRILFWSIEIQNIRIQYKYNWLLKSYNMTHTMFCSDYFK